MARVLITGASGFVGANVARGLLARGHDVHLLVRASPRTWRLEGFDQARLHVADMLDRAALDALLARAKPNAVLHLAAYGAYATQTDAALCVRTNLESSVNLMDAAAAAGVARFVHTGSSSEYGFKDHPPDEAEPLEPNSLYAVTKAAATAYAVHLARAGQLHATTLRLYSVYGPYEDPARLIPRMIVFGLRRAYPPLVSPAVARDFVYVDDVVDAYAAALETDVPPGTVYNIGTGVQTSLADVVETSRARFGIVDPPRWDSMPQREWDTTVWVANVHRAGRDLGWQARTPFTDGFRRTAEWIAASDERRRFYDTP